MDMHANSPRGIKTTRIKMIRCENLATTRNTLKENWGQGSPRVVVDSVITTITKLRQMVPSARRPSTGRQFIYRRIPQTAIFKRKWRHQYATDIFPT